MLRALPRVRQILRKLSPVGDRSVASRGLCFKDKVVVEHRDKP